MISKQMIAPRLCATIETFPFQHLEGFRFKVASSTHKGRGGGTSLPSSYIVFNSPVMRAGLGKKQQPNLTSTFPFQQLEGFQFEEALSRRGRWERHNHASFSIRLLFGLGWVWQKSRPPPRPMQSASAHHKLQTIRESNVYS